MPLQQRRLSHWQKTSARICCSTGSRRLRPRQNNVSAELDEDHGQVEGQHRRQDATLSAL